MSFSDPKVPCPGSSGLPLPYLRLSHTSRYFHEDFYSFVVVSPGFQAAATKLSLGASIGLWLEFRRRWGLVNPRGPLCCRKAPRPANHSPAGAVAPPPVALLGSGNRTERVRRRQRTAVVRRSAQDDATCGTNALSFPVSCFLPLSPASG